MKKKPFLSILDPLERLDAEGDTSLALIQEASSRGVDNFACELKDIFVRDGKVHFLAWPIQLSKGYTKPPKPLAQKRIMRAEDFSIIFMRKDPPVDEPFIAALLMLRCHNPDEVVIVNNPDGVLLANEKLFGQKIAPQFFPKTIVSSARDVLLDFIAEHDQVVIKPLWQSAGGGVLAFERGDKNVPSALELLTKSFTTPIKAQEYIKNARLGDKRVFVVGGECIGAINRLPSPDDHRANCHVGGKVEAAVVDERDREIVAVLKPHLKAMGLHVVGIDVVGGYLTEINVTSPTLIIEMEQLSQKPHERPIRAQIMDYIEGLIA